MTKNTVGVWLCVLVMGLSASSLWAQESADALLERLPAQTVQENAEIHQALLALGSEALVDLCMRLTPPEKGGDEKIRWALNGLAKHASRYGDASDKALPLTQAFVAALDQVSNDEVRAFLIRQLQVVGGKEVIPVLSAYVSNPRLGDAAIQALQTIAGRPAIRQEAVAVLHKALAKDAPRRCLRRSPYCKRKWKNAWARP